MPGDLAADVFSGLPVATEVVVLRGRMICGIQVTSNAAAIRTPACRALSSSEQADATSM